MDLFQIATGGGEGPAMLSVRSDAKESMNEMTLAGHITLRQPTDRPLPNQMRYSVRRSPGSGMAARNLPCPPGPLPGAGKVVPLPYRLTPLALPYMEQIAANDLRDQARFIVVSRGAGELYQAWLQGRLSEKHYRAEAAGHFGNVHVTVFSLRP